MNAALESISELANTLKEERDIARLESDEAIADYQRVYKERDDAVAECKSLWSLVNANKLRAYKAERERDRLREALGYIAHAGLSARHIEDYAKDFLRREEDEK